MRNRLLFTGVVLTLLFTEVTAQNNHAVESKFMSYKGLVMAKSRTIESLSRDMAAAVKKALANRRRQ